MTNGILATFLQFIVKSVKATSVATGVPLPGLEAVADLLDNVITLCERVPQNKNAARQLANRCRHMYQLLEQYEKADLIDRTLKCRQDVFNCLETVKSRMTIWAGKTWFFMLLHQDEFGKEIDECNAHIRHCLDTLTAMTNLETLAYQKESENWNREFKESVANDHNEIRQSLTSANLVQHAIESNIMECRADVRKLLEIVQKHFSESTSSKDERDRMGNNLYDLLRWSRQLLPNLQLDAGEVEWSNQDLVSFWKDMNVYKGRYLKREDVMIKIIRSFRKDESSIKRVRREVELWAKLYEVDQGRHIVPFYGFCARDNVHLALVCPWIEKGDALAYVKSHDQLVDYKSLIRGIAEGLSVLHSMDEPVMHGQLKAEKVVIGNDGRPLLMDFALAKLEGNILSQSADAYRWHAPELCFETSFASPNSDVYSFGMTVLELFTHERPYATIRKGLLVMDRMRNGIGPDRPSEARVRERGLDDGMWTLLLSCWSFEPEKRPSIQDLLTRL